MSAEKVIPIEVGQKIHAEKRIKSINESSDERQILILDVGRVLEESEEALSREMNKPVAEIDHTLVGLLRDYVAELSAARSQMIARTAQGIEQEKQLKEKISVIEKLIAEKKY